MLKIYKNCIALQQCCALVSSECNTITRRWAGHSKWQNIKHVKAAKDEERTRIFTKLVRMIKVAIVENNNIADPEGNNQLANVIGQCRKANMPVTTIQNALKNAKPTKGPAEVLSTITIRGPGRCAFMLEVATTNLPHFKNMATYHMKKHGCTFEKAVTHDFVQKGLIIAAPLNDSKSVLDDATDHAIAAGAEDVTIDEETKKLKFECAAQATWKAKKALEEQGYIIESATVEYIPTSLAQLTDDQLEVVQKFIAKIEAMPEVMSITDNIE